MNNFYKNIHFWRMKIKETFKNFFLFKIFLKNQNFYFREIKIFKKLNYIIYFSA